MVKDKSQFGKGLLIPILAGSGILLLATNKMEEDKVIERPNTVEGRNSIEQVVDYKVDDFSNDTEKDSEEDFNEFSYLDVYSDIIENHTNFFNRKHDLNLDPDLVKAMISIESGHPRDREGAFRYDPMQIANKGDFALKVLANKNTNLIGNFDRLKNKVHTPWNKKKSRWDYSNSNMDADSSIYGGIGWLFYKKAIREVRDREYGDVIDYLVNPGDNFWNISEENNTTVGILRKYNPNVVPEKIKPGQKINLKKGYTEVYISSWDSWKKSVGEYNGNGDSNYVEKVYRNLKSIKNSSK